MQRGFHLSKTLRDSSPSQKETQLDFRQSAMDGHLGKNEGCSEVTAKYKFPLTEETATKLLEDDLPNYTSCFGKALKGNVKLNQNQFAALTSWIFNMGCGAAQGSSLVKRLNAGESANKAAEEELPKWVKAGGQVIKGLVLRRAAEVKLFKTASSKQSYPGCT